MGQHADFDKITLERGVRAGMARDKRDRRRDPDKLDDRLDCFFP
jgi:hypothetical protein